MRLGIEHGTSKASRSEEGNRSQNDHDNGPHWKQRVNVDSSLLVAVGEVVVACADVVERSSLVHANETSVEVRRSSVELHAILNVLLNSIGIVVVLSQELAVGEAVGLAQVGHPSAARRAVEEGGMARHPRVGCGDVVVLRGDLNDVASVGLVGSFSGISSGVGVASGPLEVNVVVDVSVKELRNKVVLSGRVHLDNVASLAADVEVVDAAR